MKTTKTLYFILLFLFAISCDKKAIQEEVPQSIVTNDSNDVVSMPHEELDPDTTFIIFPGSTSADVSCFLDTCHMPGTVENPQGYDFPSVRVACNNPNLQVSFGKNAENEKYLLERDSAINGKLTWYNSFYAQGNHHCTRYYAYCPDYIGLKLTKGDKVYYGWIKYENLRFAEYALDTIGPANYGTVRAGRLERK